MIDIVGQVEGGDLSIYNAQTERAKNILSVQIGSLEYEPTMGIDLVFWLNQDFRFANESFQSYLIQVLASWGINSASFTESIESLSRQYTFNLKPEENGTSLMSR